MGDMEFMMAKNLFFVINMNYGNEKYVDKTFKVNINLTYHFYVLKYEYIDCAGGSIT